MPNSVDKIRIHNAIVGLLLAGPFYAVTYDPSTRLAADIDTATAVVIPPASMRVNEITASFGTDEHSKREFRDKRTSWAWIGIAKFNQEVTGHEFEELMSHPPIVARDATFRQATIRLEAATYSHPTEQGSHAGTIAEYTFTVTLSER